MRQEEAAYRFIVGFIIALSGAKVVASIPKKISKPVHGGGATEESPAFQIELYYTGPCLQTPNRTRDKIGHGKIWSDSIHFFLPISDWILRIRSREDNDDLTFGFILRLRPLEERVDVRRKPSWKLLTTYSNQLTAMAGVLWALSSVLDLDWKVLQPPSTIPTRFSWLQEILSVHETVKQAVLHRNPERPPVDGYFQDQVLGVLAHGLANGDLEEKCVTVACLGGLSEGVCLKGGKNRVVPYITKLQEGLVLVEAERVGNGSGQSKCKLEASLGICVGRLHASVGDLLGYPSTCVGCMLTALLEFILPLDGLLEGAKINSVCFGKEWLSMYEGSLLSQEIWRLVRAVTESVSLLDRLECGEAVRRLADVSQDLGSSYLTYIKRSPSGYISRIPGDLIKKTLARLFLVVVRLLKATFGGVIADRVSMAGSPPNNAEPLEEVENIRSFLKTRNGWPPGDAFLTPVESSALLVLETIGNLQFARVSNEEYVVLLQSALGQLMGNGTTARSLLMYSSLFPDFDILAAPSEMDGNLPVWQSDPILLAKVVFLMRLGPLVLNNLGEKAGNSHPGEGRIVDLVKSLAPYSFLLLHHAEELIRRVAHGFFETLIVSLASRALVNDVDELIHFYVDRSFDGKHQIPMDTFSSCFAKFLGFAPLEGVSLRYVLDRVMREVLDEISEAGLISEWGVSVFELLCRSLIWVPLSFLPYCMNDIRKVVSREGGRKTMPVLCSVVGNNRDYTRKVDLAKFYLGLRGSLTLALGEHQQNNLQA
ncbi:hypothetical protein BSKO_02123 [Bryopsis sp. KO-2023]|nr:hypothetical protein BSKO_02123 [Bryopsis sp. KO-2023]